MKFRMMMKTPDCLDMAIEDAVGSMLYDFEGDKDAEEDKRIELTQETKEFAEKWVKWSEYITIEFDTEAKTAVVVPVEEW